MMMARKRKGSIEDQIERDRLSKIRAYLRRCWLKWPERLAALEAARRPYVGTDKRRKWWSECAMCKKWFLESEMEVDHIVPAGSFTNWELHKVSFITGLFCGRENLQVLCPKCHLKKTAEDRRKK